VVGKDAEAGTVNRLTDPAGTPAGQHPSAGEAGSQPGDPKMMRGAAPRLTPEAAAERLADWGFLARADLPNVPGNAHLIVGIRDQPTFRHFDPESVEFWVSTGASGQERGSRVVIHRTTPLPIERPFSWGMIRITDRLGISNDYVGFGGWLSAAEVNGMTVCVFSSPAPILRRGGHSQLADPGSFDLAAWFGRVMIAVDYTPGFEGRVATASPLGRYCAFIADFMERRGRSPELRASAGDLWPMLRDESRRLQHEQPEAWAEGMAIRAAAAVDTQAQATTG
jgi:hypothetical protein